MVDNGELEFFEFNPTDFINDLQLSVEETIDLFIEKEFGFLKTKKVKMLKELLLEASKKNFLLFRNFVIKNLMSFPQKFTFERKKTYSVEKKTLDNALLDYQTQLEKLIEARDQVNKLKETLAILKYENQELKELLEGEEDLKMLSSCLEDLKNKYKATKEMVNKIPFCSLDDENFNSLLEHRELRTEMLKKELERLTEAVDVDYLATLV